METVLGRLPDVAVVIPLYNGAPWVRATLDAVSAQTHPPREIVVVDNGSSDDGPVLVSAWPDVRLVHCAKQGTDLARQTGLEQTTSPLVALLDQDDLWHPAHLELLATALVHHPDAVAAVDTTRWFMDGQPPAFDPPVLDLDRVDPWDVYPGCFTPTPSGALIRRSALRESGGWVSGYLGCADTYMWLRLSVAGTLVRNRCTTAAHRRFQTSHNGRLRTERPNEYMAHIVRAAVDVTREREQQRPDERATLADKRALVRAAGRMQEALRAREGAALADAAREMETGARTCTERQIIEALGLVLWMLGPVWSHPEGYDLTWQLLVRDWPPQARRTGRARFALTSGRRAWACLRRRPTDLWRWRLVARVLGRRLAAPSS